nr:MAG TPA: hypothetical protein [Caudoviricetes sp.]
MLTSCFYWRSLQSTAHKSLQVRERVTQMSRPPSPASCRTNTTPYLPKLSYACSQVTPRLWLWSAYPARSPDLSSARLSTSASTRTAREAAALAAVVQEWLPP